MIQFLMLAGTAVKAYGEYRAGQEAGDSLDKQMLESRLAAVRRRLKAADDARIIRETGERFRERQAVGFAKSGVLLDSGSPLFTMMDTAIRVEKNALRAILEGQWEAESYDKEASAYGIMAQNARRAGEMKAVGSFIGGATAHQGNYSPSTGSAMSQREYLNLTSDFGDK